MRSLRILVVEDNAIIAMLLGEMLRAMGHDPCGMARTEEDAVAVALRLRPDLMIVDAHLGTGSGVSAVETVCRTRVVPHVFMSGAPVDTRGLSGPVLSKPFLESDLARAIEAAVSARAA